MNSDIAGIAIFAFGAFASLSMFFTSFTGIIGVGMKKLLFTIVGLGAYVLPIFLMFIGICYIVKRGKINFSKRFYGLILAFINTLMFIQMNVLDEYYINNNLSQGIKLIYNSNSVFHGGIICYLLDIPIYKLFGKGYIVIFISAYLVAFLLISEKSLGDIIKIKRIPKNQRKGLLLRKNQLMKKRLYKKRVMNLVE